MLFLARTVMQSPTRAMMMCALLGALTLVLSPIGFLSGAVIALVTLVAGLHPGFKMLIVTLISGGIVGLALGATSSVLISLVEFWLPAFVLGIVLGKTKSLSQVLVSALLLASLGLFAAYVLLPGTPQMFWQEMMQQLVTQSQAQGAYLDAEAIVFLTELVPPSLTMLVAMGLTLVWVGMLFLARWWQGNLYPPASFANEFQTIALTRSVAVVAAALFALSLFVDATWLRDALAIFAVVLTVQGLSVVHFWAQVKQVNKGWLVLVYVMLTLLPHMVVMLAMFGWMDNWLDWRSKLNANPNA